MGAPSMKKRRTDPAASGESALDAAKRSWRSDEAKKNKQNGTRDEVEEQEEEGIVNSQGEDEEMKTEENEQNLDEPEDSEVSSLSADDEDGSDDDDNFPSSEDEDGASTTQRGPQQPAGGGLKGLATAFQRIFAKAGESEARGSGGKRAVISSPDGAGEKKDDENVTESLTTDDVEGGKKAGDSETKKSKKKSKAARPLAEFEKKAEEAAIQENQKTRLARQLKATESLQARGIQTKPDIFKEQTFERELRSLATRGVVKLFTSMHQLQKQEGILVSATGKSKKAERALEYAKERQQKREERADQMIYRHD
eukprot:g8223.t1